MRQNNLHVSRKAIADLCRRHHIRRLSLFGSILCDDFGSDSAVVYDIVWYVAKVELPKLIDSFAQLLPPEQRRPGQ